MQVVFTIQIAGSWKKIPAASWLEDPNLHSMGLWATKQLSSVAKNISILLWYTFVSPLYHQKMVLKYA